MNASASVLQVGDWVHVDGEDHQVVALSGTSVRLLSASGAASVVLASFLLGALDFALVKATTTPRRVEPFGLLEGLPGEAVAQAREWERHLVEVVTGLPPGAPQDAKPRPQYDVAVPLNERDRAKAEELTAAGQPVSERTVRRLRARYAEQGLVGLVDQRVMRPTSTVGRADDRLVTAIRAELDVQTHTSTGTRDRLMRRVVARLEAEHGPGVVPVPARTTFYELVNQLATGRHSFGTATTRRSLANRPARACAPTFALRPGEIIQIDSTPLDVMAVLDDGVLGRPELTTVVDVATRTIAAAVLRPEGTKAIDASLLLARMLVPEPMRPGEVRRAADVRLDDPVRPAPGHRHPPAAGRGQAGHRPGDHRHRPRQGLRLGGVHPRLRVPGHQPAARPAGHSDRQGDRGTHLLLDQHLVLPARRRLHRS